MILTLFCPIISRYYTGWVFSCIPFDDTVKIEIVLIFIVQIRTIRLRIVKMFIQSHGVDGVSLQPVTLLLKSELLYVFRFTAISDLLSLALP